MSGDIWLSQLGVGGMLLASREYNQGCVIEQKKLVHRALAEPNTKYRELQCRNVGDFIDIWHHPGEREAHAQKPKRQGGV